MANPKVDELDNSDDVPVPQATLPDKSNNSIQDVDQLLKLLDERLDAKLKPVLGEVRGVQSRQDKDRTAFQEFAAEYRNQKAKGLPDNEAEAAASEVLDQRERQNKMELLLDAFAKEKGLDLATLKMTGKNLKSASGYEKVIEKFGLDANDPMVATLMRDNPDVVDFSISIGHYALEQKTAPTPTEAQKAAATASRSVTSDADSLLTEYNEAMKTPSRTGSRMKEIEKQLIEMGVWNS